MGAGGLDWGGEDLIGAGGLDCGGVYCNKPRLNILCGPQHAAALRKPRPYGSRGLTGATAVREPRPYGMSGSGAHQGEVVMLRAAGYSPAFSLHDDLACIFKYIKQAKIILQLVVFSKHK